MPVGMDYSDFKQRFVSDPAQIMKDAAKRKMNFSQYANAMCPESLLTDKVNVVSRILQEEGLFTRSSDICLASTVDEFIEKPHTEVLLHDILYRSYNGKRNALTTGFEDAVGSVLYPGTPSAPRVDKQVQPAINIDEITSMTTPITSSTYKPFRWIYDKDALERKPVAPGSPVPVTTLGQKEDNIQLNKWGNRFQLAYEALREYDASD